MAAVIDTAGPPPADTPLDQLLGTYTQCLNLSREYVRRDLEAAPDGEVDPDALEHFLCARADLLALAETSLTSLAGQGGNEPARQEVKDKVMAVLEEMTRMETRLADFLGDRLEQMRQTIGRMKKSEPVFRHYAYLGGPVHPSRITRHE